MEQINLDLIPGRISPICHASQYDVGRVIRINIIDGYSQPYMLDGTEAISVNVRKTDGNVVVESLEVVTGRSYVDVVTTEQMTCCYGSNVCDLTIEKSNILIGTLNFILEVEQDPLDGGVESTTVIHNLTAQIRAINEEMLPDMVAEQLATMYDGSDVLFDTTPTEGHGIPYTVTSEGIKAKFDGLDLSEDSLNNVDLDPEINDGDALVYNATTNKWINAEAGKKTLAELNDVDLTTTPTDKQVLIYDDTTEMWIAGDGSRVWQGTQAQYDALTEVDPAVTYFITDGGSIDLTLSELQDTNISSPSSGQVLSYNGSKWVNTSMPTTCTITVGSSMPTGFPIAKLDRYDKICIFSCDSQLPANNYSSSDVLWNVTPAPKRATRSLFSLGTANNTVIVTVYNNGEVRFNSSQNISSAAYLIGELVYYTDG